MNKKQVVIKIFSVLCFLILYFIAANSILVAKEKINIKGFGELPVTKNGTSFNIDFGNLGAFSFEGTLNPQSLTTTVELEKLKGFPGYKLYSKLGLEEISLEITGDGLEIVASIDTKKNLAKLMNFFKITQPKLEVSAAISKDAFELEGTLDFSEKPIVIDIRPERTRLTLNKFGVGAEVSKGESVELTLGVSAEVLVKPTKFDPDLKTVLAFSYNLMSQELSIAGSMTDTWKNPMGISNIFKGKDVVTLENTAIEIGWIPGTPSPTTLGFALESGKFFHLDFGIVMSLSLDDGKIAIKANRNQMTMNDFTQILRDGFNLKVPDIFPKNIYIRDAEILFAPQGGSVGEVDIEAGFTLRGVTKLTDALSAKLNYHTNLKDGFVIYYKLDNNFKDEILHELKNKKVLSKILTPILSSLQVEQAEVMLKANKDLQLDGHTHYEVYVMNERVPIPDFKATLDVKEMVKNVVNKIVEKYGGKATKLAKKISSSAKIAGNKVGQGAKFAQKMVKLGVSNAKHLHPKGILNPVNKHICREQCIPNRANELIGKVLPPSLQAIQAFHDDIIGDMITLQGKNAAETKRIRESFFLADWNKLNTQIEEDWKSIWEDKFYYGLFIRKSAAIEGGNIYRNIITKRKREYLNLKNKLYNSLISKKLPATLRIEYDKNAGCGSLFRNNKFVKKHCGWHKNWTMIIQAGYVKNPRIGNRVLFYEKNMGIIAVYSIDDVCNMYELANLKGISKYWKNITWYEQGAFDGYILFEDANGYSEAYKMDDKGNLSRYVGDISGTNRLLPKGDSRRLNIEQGPVSIDPMGDGAWSAFWEFEPVPGTNYLRIKNRWKGTYLNIEQGPVKANQIGTGAHSSHWLLESAGEMGNIRIKNRWKGTYLVKTQKGVECRKVSANAPESIWVLEKVE